MAEPNSPEEQLLGVHALTTLRSATTLQYYALNNAYTPSHNPTPYYLLSHHLDRLLAAARALNFPSLNHPLTTPSGLRYLESLLNHHVAETYPSDPESAATNLRIRITLTATFHITITSSPAPSLPLAALFPTSLTAPHPTLPRTWQKIILSPTTISPSPYTRHKTTLRRPYDAARAHLTPDQLSIEVLIFNHDEELMEGTLTTPYFNRGGRWITPAEGCGGNMGVTRRWALEKGLCEEGIVRKKEVRDGEVVWLSNGVRGFGWGFVVLEGWDVGEGEKVEVGVSKEEKEMATKAETKTEDVAEEDVRNHTLWRRARSDHTSPRSS